MLASFAPDPLRLRLPDVQRGATTLARFAEVPLGVHLTEQPDGLLVQMQVQVHHHALLPDGSPGEWLYTTPERLFSDNSRAVDAATGALAYRNDGYGRAWDYAAGAAQEYPCPDPQRSAEAFAAFLHGLPGAYALQKHYLYTLYRTPLPVSIRALLEQYVRDAYAPAGAAAA